MPTAPPPFCAVKGCPSRATVQGKCTEHHYGTRRESDARRGSGTRRGSTTRWRRFREDYLLRHPLCECDECLSIPAAFRPLAMDINHLDDASRTSPDAYDESKLVAMSHEHHARYTARHQPGGWHKRNQERRSGSSPG